MGPYELLEKAVSAFEGLEIPYLVTGSVASMAYGEPRLTNDIDIVAAVEESHIPGLLSAFPQEDYCISADMIREAVDRRGQFNIIHPASGLKIDVIISKESPFDRSRFRRARRISPGENYEADFASPEDVIIKKMEYYREGGSEKHLRDITGILITSGDDVDREYILRWAENLGLLKIWAAIEKRLQQD